MGLGFIGIGIFWDFLGFLNFQIGIGFFWVFGIGIFWVFLGFFGFFGFSLYFLNLKLVLVFLFFDDYLWKYSQQSACQCLKYRSLKSVHRTVVINTGPKYGI